MITGIDSDGDRRHWDRLFNTKHYLFGREASTILLENFRYLPGRKALDLAMGEGRNSVYLAKHGFSVDGVDFSEVALRKAKQLARESHVRVTTIFADLNHYTIRPESYDVIVNIDYLQRSLIPRIKKGLKHGGVIVFENHTLEQLSKQSNHLRRDTLLNQGELKQWFSDFQILQYREIKDASQAKESLVARKP